ncbi:hypothetical protein BDV93DRAFT_522443 [Ceratobasidium sp. AG-I]|nr:hypothetical protein BDV93DRAFT_522443 [Ceratobasidium sp. AG-I]
MSRRSNRQAPRVSYAELAGEVRPEASSSKRKGKRKATEDSDFELVQEPEEPVEISESELSEGSISPPPPPESESGSELDASTSKQPSKRPSKSTSKPKPATKQKSAPAQPKHTRRIATREANARARPCPAYFPDPAVHLESGAYGLFEAVEVKKDEGKRDVVGTRKARDKLGMNVGAGPGIDMCEDLGWFKEGRDEDGMRSNVYGDVEIKKEDWVVMEEIGAGLYISGRQPANADSATCLMGPFGQQKPVQIKSFETLALGEHWPSVRGCVFNVGDPVWGLDWCPTSEAFSAKHDYAQYLAISTIPASPLPHETNPPEIDSSLDPPPSSKDKSVPQSAIQIWRFGPSRTPTDQEDFGTASCVMVLCLDGVPPARMLRWCPLPADDKDEPAKEGNVRKLGILAGLFMDGSIAVYAVPEPSSFGDTKDRPIYVKAMRPLVSIAVPDARFTCLDWANSEVMAVGCSNGNIAVYNLQSTILGKPSYLNLPLLPTHYISVHQSRIQSLRWIRLPAEPNDPTIDPQANPTMIVSGGFDGLVYVTDLRACGVPVSMYRCRDVIQSVAFTTYGAGVISNEHENMIKFTGMHPLVLGRGHNVSEVRGPVWDIATSDLHPHVAVASADGTLSVANLLKYMRKGSPMPAFIHTIYRMDYNRTTKELRMLDLLTPRVYKDPRHAGKARGVKSGVDPPDATPAQKATAERERDGFGTWSPQVGIHCAAWVPCRLGQAGVLASGGASGLVRIDVLRERTFNLKKAGMGDVSDDDGEDGDEGDELDEE